MAEPPVMKKGWMKKQGRKGMIKNWKRRFFILNRGHISYYEKELTQAPYGDSLKGELHLANTEIIIENKKYNEKQIFVVSFSGEYNLLMEADSTEEADAWVDAIELHIKHANGGDDDSEEEEDSRNSAADAAARQKLRDAKAGSMLVKQPAADLVGNSVSESDASDDASPLAADGARSRKSSSLPAISEDSTDVPVAATAPSKHKVAAIIAAVEAEKIDLAMFMEQAPQYVQNLVGKIMGGDSRVALVGEIMTGGQVLVTSVMKNNEGEFGTRGEKYLAVIFVLSCSIIIGLHSVLEMVIRFFIGLSASIYVVVGLGLIVTGMFELKSNLSLFYLPIDRNKLVTSGVFRMVRHPVYGGLLLLCIGLSITSQRWDKMVLSVLLGLVLDKVSDLEEAALLQEHPLAYQAFIKSRKKFIPFLC
mmetsp:Transcript_34063/g.70329  ORF Transcript_34063/g.70329 Transcript_34063/m.70329 type:complete len:420 (+) Transcript_34063:115-1374(+)